jgi:hypothetical protein
MNKIDFSSFIIGMTIVFVVAIIAGALTYYFTHRPPMEQCRDSCGSFGMVKSYDPNNGCICR